MHHVPWCMSGSLTRSGGENVPGIPVAYTTRNFAYLVRDPWIIWLIHNIDDVNEFYFKLWPFRILAIIIISNIHYECMNNVSHFVKSCFLFGSLIVLSNDMDSLAIYICRYNQTIPSWVLEPFISLILSRLNCCKIIETHSHYLYLPCRWLKVCRDGDNTITRKSVFKMCIFVFDLVNLLTRCFDRYI